MLSIDKSLSSSGKLNTIKRQPNLADYFLFSMGKIMAKSNISYDNLATIDIFETTILQENTQCECGYISN